MRSGAAGPWGECWGEVASVPRPGAGQTRGVCVGGSVLGWSRGIQSIHSGPSAPNHQHPRQQVVGGGVLSSGSPGLGVASPLLFALDTTLPGVCERAVSEAMVDRKPLLDVGRLPPQEVCMGTWPGGQADPEQGGLGTHPHPCAPLLTGCWHSSSPLPDVR